MDAEASSTFHPTVHPLAGILRVRVMTSGASFDVDGVSVKVREVSSGATLGYLTKRDLCVQGTGAESVSRLHLTIRLMGHFWTVTDHDTPNKTYEVVPDSAEPWPLPAMVAIPVEDGLRLRLGHKLVVVFEIEPVRSGENGTTPRLRTPDRVRPHDLEKVALELLASRRHGAGGQIPSVKELASRLGRSSAETRRSLRDLRQLVRLSALERRPERVADALGQRFPYLQARV